MKGFRKQRSEKTRKTPYYTYILLSPTFGMHQYTADLANRAAQASGVGGQASGVRGQGSEREPLVADGAVRLITTTTLPRDRYSPAVQIITPVTAHGTGFSREGLDLAAYRRVHSAICHLPSAISHQPSAICHLPSAICHFTGVHAWNLPLVYALRRRGVPVIHTLHDLDPHTGVRFPALIRLWNRLIIASGCHILVHGQRYRDQLIAAGVPADRVTYAPLLHGFLAADRPWPPEASGVRETTPPPASSYIPTFAIRHSPFTFLFFGRIEAYKGIEVLLKSWRKVKDLWGEESSLMMGEYGELRELRERRERGERGELREAKEIRGNSCHSWQTKLIIAGPVAQGMALPPLPPGVELRDRRILDDEADALFRSADVLVLPYRDATQSALIAAAYAYGLPVIATATGALPEYVVEGETGWLVPPDDPDALTAALMAALDAALTTAPDAALTTAPDAALTTAPDAAACCGLAPMRAAARAWFEAQRMEEEVTLAKLYNLMSF